MADPNIPSPTTDQAADDYTKATAGLSQEQIGSDYDSAQGPHKSSFTGGLADDFFSNQPVGKIMSAFGQGAAQGWGADTLHLEGELKATVAKNPGLKEFVDNHKTLSKDLNEGFIRPWAHLIDSVVGSGQKVFSAGMGAAGGVIGSVAEQLDDEHKKLSQDPNIPSWGVSKVLGGLAGAASEYVGAALPSEFDPYNNPYTGEHTGGATAAFIPDLPEAFHKARTEGLIGEGEKGYFSTEPVSQEALQARSLAAHEAGLPEAPPPRPVQTDPNLLAREIDPETFKEWDRLHELQDNLRESINYQGGRRGSQFEREIHSILSPVEGDESLLPGGMKDRLDNARARLEEARNQDTPEMSKMRQSILEADSQIRDLIPATADARARVEELMKSEGSEGEAFRNYFQNKLLENQLKIDGLQEDVEAAHRHAESLLPDPLNSKEKPNADTDDTSKSSKSATEVNPEVSKQTAEAGPSPTLADEGTGEIKTSGLAKSLEANAIERGLSGTFGDLPEYYSMNMKNEAAIVQKVMDDDWMRAKRIAFGREDPPEGSKAMSFLVGVEERATELGDSETLRRLGNSNLTVRASHAAQDLRILAERNPESATAAMKVVQDARENISTKASRAEVETIKQEVSKAATSSSAAAWNEFIEGIVCK